VIEEQKVKDAATRTAPGARCKAYAKAAAERDRIARKSSDLRAALGKVYGKVPPVLSEQLYGDRGVLAHHEHWHCVAYRDSIANRVGKRWTVKQVYAVIAQSFRLH
jgi:hypothetical protein